MIDERQASSSLTICTTSHKRLELNLDVFSSDPFPRFCPDIWLLVQYNISTVLLYTRIWPPGSSMYKFQTAVIHVAHMLPPSLLHHNHLESNRYILFIHFNFFQSCHLVAIGFHFQIRVVMLITKSTRAMATVPVTTSAMIVLSLASLMSQSGIPLLAL